MSAPLSVNRWTLHQIIIPLKNGHFISSHTQTPNTFWASLLTQSIECLNRSVQIRMGILIVSKKAKYSDITSKTKRIFIYRLLKSILTYAKGVTNRLSRILQKNNIATTFILTTKISHLLRTLKNSINISYTGSYQIPINCGKFSCHNHISSRFTQIRKKKNISNIFVSINPNFWTTTLLSYPIINFDKNKVLVKNPVSYTFLIYRA